MTLTPEEIQAMRGKKINRYGVAPTTRRKPEGVCKPPCDCGYIGPPEPPIPATTDEPISQPQGCCVVIGSLRRRRCARMGESYGVGIKRLIQFGRWIAHDSMIRTAAHLAAAIRARGQR